MNIKYIRLLRNVFGVSTLVFYVIGIYRLHNILPYIHYSVELPSLLVSIKPQVDLLSLNGYAIFPGELLYALFSLSLFMCTLYYLEGYENGKDCKKVEEVI